MPKTSKKRQTSANMKLLLNSPFDISSSHNSADNQTNFFEEPVQCVVNA